MTSTQVGASLEVLSMQLLMQRRRKSKSLSPLGLKASTPAINERITLLSQRPSRCRSTRTYPRMDGSAKLETATRTCLPRTMAPTRKTSINERDSTLRSLNQRVCSRLKEQCPRCCGLAAHPAPTTYRGLCRHRSSKMRFCRPSQVNQ